jgi:hypothetical protein
LDSVQKAVQNSCTWCRTLEPCTKDAQDSVFCTQEVRDNCSLYKGGARQLYSVQRRCKTFVPCTEKVQDSFPCTKEVQDRYPLYKGGAKQ